MAEMLSMTRDMFEEGRQTTKELIEGESDQKVIAAQQGDEADVE